MELTISRTCSYKFCDVHLLCSLICITYHAARWMLTGANVYQGSSRAKRAANFITRKMNGSCYVQAYISGKNDDFRRHHGAATPILIVRNRCKVDLYLDLYLSLNPKTWM